MARLNKLIIVCLIVVFSLMLAGCSENTDIKNESSDISSVVSGKNEKVEAEGIELPEEEFNSTEESSGSQNTGTNKEDDGKTSSSEDSNSQNSSSAPDSTTSSTQDDATSSETESKEDNTSSDDDTSKPIESDDGIIELPMDKW